MVKGYNLRGNFGRYNIRYVAERRKSQGVFLYNSRGFVCGYAAYGYKGILGMGFGLCQLCAVRFDAVKIRIKIRKKRARPS